VIGDVLRTAATGVGAWRRRPNEPDATQDPTGPALRLLQRILESEDLNKSIREFNAYLSDLYGFTCVEVAFKSRKLAVTFGCQTVDEVGGEGFPVEFGVSKRDSGVLWIRLDEGVDRLLEEAVALLSALGSAIARLAESARLNSDLSRTKNRLAIALRSSEISAGLDETVSGVNLLWQSLSEQARRNPDSAPLAKELLALRGAVTAGLLELDEAVGSLAARRVKSQGLIESLRDVLLSFEQITGTSTGLTIEGEPRRLPADVEESLYMIVFEALSTSEARSRASAVVLTLSFLGDVTLTIRDDGVGLLNRASDGPWPGIHHGMRVIRERAEAVGASLTISPARPRGIRVQARLSGS
jgi:hypothetical protein